jgi:hypothetical protein
MAVEVSYKLEDSLQKPMLPTMAFDYPNIKDLTQHLAYDLLDLSLPRNTTEKEKRLSDDPEDILAKIEALTND